jgi:hypothetical protein
MSRDVDRGDRFDIVRGKSRAGGGRLRYYDRQTKEKQWKDGSKNLFCLLPCRSKLTGLGTWGPQRTCGTPSELFRLKCASHCYTADTNSTYFNGITHWSVGSPPDATTVQ